MPVALAPSNVLAQLADPPPISTESRTRYIDFGAAAAASRPYRGVLCPEPAGVVSQPSIVDQLDSLGARLNAMRKPPAPLPPPPAPADDADTFAPAEARVPWENPYYATFAGYAGEASRVVATGRLPFGSDSKKMAL